MTKQEKEARILEIWEEKIKGNPDTITSWSLHPKSFIKWSLNKIKDESQTLVQNNKLGLWKPYNLKYSLPAKEMEIVEQVMEQIVLELDEEHELEAMEILIPEEKIAKEEEPSKKKRHRRTKAQMAEARKEGK